MTSAVNAFAIGTMFRVISRKDDPMNYAKYFDADKVYPVIGAGIANDQTILMFINNANEIASVPVDRCRYANDVDNTYEGKPASSFVNPGIRIGLPGEGTGQIGIPEGPPAGSNADIAASGNAKRGNKQS